MATLRPRPPFVAFLRPRALRFLSLGLVALAPVALRAADTPALPAGLYTLDRASLRAFEDALAKAGRQVPALQRSAVLRRLRERLDPPAEIALESSESGWALRLGDHRFPPLQPGAAPVAWTGKDGQKAHVSLRWRDRRLEQSLASGDRARLSAFSFDPAEKVLRLEIQAHGSQLPQPVAFALRYLPAANLGSGDRR